MAITDLTGYTWIGDLNSIVTAGKFASFPTYNINFIGQGDNEFNAILSEYSNPYFIIKCRRVSDNATLQLAVAQTQYNPTSSTELTISPWSWTLKFTGGTDATNTDLIAWLEANGTLQAPSSTDTKPIFKRVNGTWVKQDAFQRVSGAWVRISSKEEAVSGETWVINENVNPPLSGVYINANADITYHYYNGSQLEEVRKEEWETNGINIEINSNRCVFANFDSGGNFGAKGNNYYDKYSSLYSDWDPDGTKHYWSELSPADKLLVRTIIFHTAPTGDLLTWLQANATKQ